MPGGLAQAPLERLRLGAGGEPEVEAGADELDHLLLAEHASGARDAWRGRVERRRPVAVAGVLGHQVEDAGHAGVGRHLVARIGTRPWPLEPQDTLSGDVRVPFVFR